MATLSDFRARVALPVSATFDTQITTELEDTAAELDYTRCTSNAVAAHVYLTAHMLAKGGDALAKALGGDTAGPVASMKMGEIAAGFATAPGVGMGGRYSATKWGVKLEQYLYSTHKGITG